MHHNSVTFILTRPSHPRNVGSAARALYTMGFNQLILIGDEKTAQLCHHQDAIALSTHGHPLLKTAQIFPDLATATTKFANIIATTARVRRYNWTPITPPKLSNLIIKSLPEPTAIVFGNERTGLTNDELNHCNQHLTIPIAKSGTSLNLAQAIQIIAYEINKNFPDEPEYPHKKTNERDLPAPQEEIRYLEDHLSMTSHNLNMIRGSQTMRHFHAIINRANLSVREVKLLRSFLTKVNNKINE